MSIVEPQIATMQGRHRRRQAQSEAGTRLGSAGFEADKPLYRMFAVSYRNSRSVVGNAQ